eukprot:gene19720-23591_t
MLWTATNVAEWLILLVLLQSHAIWVPVGKGQHAISILRVLDITIVFGSAAFNFTVGGGYGCALLQFRCLTLMARIPIFFAMICNLSRVKRLLMGLLAPLILLNYAFAFLGFLLFRDVEYDCNENGQCAQYFETPSAALWTLSQVMTLDSWSSAIARPTMEVYAHAWIYFLLYVLIFSLVIANLIIGAMTEAVSGMSTDGTSTSAHSDSQDTESPSRDLSRQVHTNTVSSEYDMDHTWNVDRADSSLTTMELGEPDTGANWENPAEKEVVSVPQHKKHHEKAMQPSSSHPSFLTSNPLAVSPDTEVVWSPRETDPIETPPVSQQLGASSASPGVKESDEIYEVLHLVRTLTVQMQSVQKQVQSVQKQVRTLTVQMQSVQKQVGNLAWDIENMAERQSKHEEELEKNRSAEKKAVVMDTGPRLKGASSPSMQRGPRA